MMQDQDANQPLIVRHALVTGVASGIGKSIAARLLAEGWAVTGLDRIDVHMPFESFKAISIDLTNHDLLRELLGQFKAVDAVVHAAGFMRTAPLGALDLEDGLAMWRVHVGTAEIIANAILPGMKSGGRMVVIGSRTAAGAAGRSQYAATKAALTGMVRSWAAELAPRGVTVNIVAPGATATPMLNDPARAGTAPKLPPIGRFIEPSEIAALTAFLLGPEAGAITGQQIIICGGGSL
ncbi:SDR family NAD(P)-dependent oxidoreductase [Acidocella sp.]|uniref:SDR family NAD(P)-dependent oxidoreductase n=1 Tax=Acidocella sp. TaxID=50710 RepID=UPI0026244638|nr:SDR family oxidoreductase [Acidocella sp.]